MYEKNLRTKVVEVSWAGRSNVVPNDGISGDVLWMADLFSLLALRYSGWCYCYLNCYLKLALFWLSGVVKYICARASAFVLHVSCAKISPILQLNFYISRNKRIFDRQQNDCTQNLKKW